MTTSTMTGRKLRPMTPLNESATQRRPRYLRAPAVPTVGARPDGQAPATTADEVWYAESADGLWTYTRVEETTTPWEVVYLPTGQCATFTTLGAGRRWTAHEQGRFALANLRAGAVRVVAAGGATGAFLMFAPGASDADRRAARAAEAQRCARRLAEARRCLAVLDGLLVADEPDGRCTGGCGGYLTAVVDGDRAAWQHADACRECIDKPPAQRRQCEQAYRHVPCGDPDPVLCARPWCTTPLPATPVDGCDDCCGCCEQ